MTNHFIKESSPPRAWVKNIAMGLQLTKFVVIGHFFFFTNPESKPEVPFNRLVKTNLVKKKKRNKRPKGHIAHLSNIG
jgi:hypothetical protein